MDDVVVTVVTGFGVGTAILGIVRWGGAPGADDPFVVVDGETPSARVTLRRMLRLLSIGTLAGGLAGALTAGLGGRLMMRVLAATSADGVQGLTTDADATIGEVTADGTIGLVLFIGLFSGLAGAGAYLALRRWLPGSPRGGGLVLGLLALGLAPGIDALNRESIDFELLGPDPLAVALIVTLFPLWGMTVASFVERAERSWPWPGRSVLAIAAYAPLLVWVPAWFVLGVFVTMFCVVQGLQHVPVLGRAWTSRPVAHLVRGALAVLVLISVAWATAHAVDILGGEDLTALGP